MNTASRTMAVASAALALCMAAGSAFAQDRRHDRGNDHRNNQRFEQSHRQADGRHPGYRGHQDFRQGRHFDRKGYPHPRSEWRRGGRVPTEYRGRNYVVNDWRSHRLQAPQRGQQWVSVGGDYVLAAVATGLILQIVAGQ